MKKVLVVTYYWPPAGGPGVQRWLKFVKYLPEFGIDPIVFVPENPHYPIRDSSLSEQVPKGVTVHKGRIFEPYRFARLLSSRKTHRISSGIIQTRNQSLLEKLMLWIRGNLFIPDARKFWVKPSVDALSDLIRETGIETVVTTGPPHSVHLIGQRLREEHPIRWIADFRDPWTSIGYHDKLKLTNRSRRKHRQMEHSVLNAADSIITTSDTTRHEFERLTDRPIVTITNGHDSDYRGGAELDKAFTLSHIGSLLTGRSPRNLWKMLARLAAEDALFRSELQLEFMGVVSEDVMNDIYRYELGPYVKLRGYGSHAEALRRQRQSQLLLLIEIDSEETKGIIPGKLFEYMAARRPILAIGPEDWEVARIIHQTESGEVFDYQDETGLKNVLVDWFQAYRKGQLESRSKGVGRYSRRALTEQLAKHL